MSSTKNDSPKVPGVLSAAEVYTLPELQRRLRLGRHALRAMRRAGLKVRRIANRAFVTGADFIQFVEGQPADCDRIHGADVNVHAAGQGDRLSN